VDAWERQDKEPNLWYDRFERFRLLGVGRSIEEVFRGESTAKVSKGQHTRRPSRYWYAAARTWRWTERAEAWDAGERERIRRAEANRSFYARQVRLRRAAKMQQDGETIHRSAKIDALTPAAARELLSAGRGLLVEGMKAERLEYGEATVITQDTDKLKVSQKVDEAIAKVYA